MKNSYPEWQNFQFAPKNHYGFFFLHTLPSTITKCYFISFTLNYLNLQSRTDWFGSSQLTLTSRTFDGKWHQKDTWCHVHKSHLTREGVMGKTTLPSPGWVHGQVCKKVCFMATTLVICEDTKFGNSHFLPLKWSLILVNKHFGTCWGWYLISH